MNLLQYESIVSHLSEHQLMVVSKAGIRIFHDHIPDVAKQHQLPKLLEFEINYKNIEPFASLGQHTHLVCQKTTIQPNIANKMLHQ